MNVQTAEKIKKLDLLEGKIHAAIDTINRLNARCDSLVQKNEDLESEMNNLREHNNGLSQEIVDLKATHEKRMGSGIEEKQILGKIDRMIEKFGELQI
jgi:FtsZ-binding cell division protein ZapB